MFERKKDSLLNVPSLPLTLLYVVAAYLIPSKANKLQRAVDVVRKMINDQVEVELLIAEAESDLKHLNNRNKEVTQDLEKRQGEVEALTHEIAKLKKICLDLKREVERIKNTISEEDKFEQDVFDRSCRERDLNTGELRHTELEAEITSLTQRLELVHAGNPHVIQQYEQRAKEIERMSSRAENIDGEIIALEEKITDIRRRWEPELDELIEEINKAFSHNFNQIRCLGQVSIHKDEDDYAEWAVRIMVQFRYVRFLNCENTPLTLILVRTSNSQSSTPSVNPVANDLLRQFSISWHCNQKRAHPSALSTKSTKEWTRVTNEWCTSAWSTLHAVKTRRSIS
jgi:predicted  nucleic acid-binding Zn-ribbon protein